MNWKTTYPPLATAMEAGFDTLVAWCENLPAPQTDVERTVLRRIKVRRDELLSMQIRQKAPEIADRLNDIIDKMERMGIKSPMRKV